ncbi:MAG: holin-like protein [Clostridiales bacterium]|nr:holin-like protein [Clostridiales bacterium]
MKFLKQFGIILGMSFLGEICHFLLPFPIPASIYGLLILFIALCKKWIRVGQIKETALFLIEIMPLMFIPAAVGITTAWEQVFVIVVPLCVITLLTTILVMVISGRMTQFVIRRGNKK